MQDLIQQLASELDKDPRHVENVVRLLDEGNTIPFIARYRKELHGAMDDTALRDSGGAPPVPAEPGGAPGGGEAVHRGAGQADGGALRRHRRRRRRWRRWRTCTAPTSRSAAPGPPLPGKRAWRLWRSCCLPRGRTARTRRRRPPGMWIPEKGVETVEDALSGRQRHHRRDRSATTPPSARASGSLLEREGKLCSQAGDGGGQLSTGCTTTSPRPCSRLQGHQMLAVNRGEKEGFLKVTRGAGPGPGPAGRAPRRVIVPAAPPWNLSSAAAEDAYDRLIFPSLEREVRSDADRAGQRGGHRPVCPEPEAPADAAAR